MLKTTGSKTITEDELENPHSELMTEQASSVDSSVTNFFSRKMMKMMMFGCDQQPMRKMNKMNGIQHYVAGVIHLLQFTQ